MPTRPAYVCGHPRCRKKAVHRGYCRVHYSMSRAGSKDRANASDRGYDKQWEKVRKMKLARNPLCEDCEADGLVRPADMVDHVIPLRVAPDLRLRLENLRSLCWPHHGRKSAEDKRKYPGHYDGGTT